MNAIKSSQHATLKHDIMETSEKITFPKLENEYLVNILRQLVCQYSIIQIFFNREKSSAFSHLIIHIENSIDATKLQGNKWVKKVKNQFLVDVYFIYSQKLHHRFSFGHPFIEFYCQPSALIYQNEEAENQLVITRNWKKYKNRFKQYTNHFYHDHDLHKWQIQNLISEDASNSVFTSYARLVQYNLDYLEELYSGHKSACLSLNERITNLIPFIPDIQKYFVKNSPSRYYLIDLFVQAKEATAEDDSIYRNEMFDAVGTAEQNLNRLIEERFDELKKLIKKGSSEEKEVLCQTTDKPKDGILDTALQIILKWAEAEQIYLYQQTTCPEKTTYYLMLITAGTGNEKLKLITDSLKSTMGEKYNFVLISHSRYWIQNNLYEYQNFFAGIIQDNYLIYSSSAYHPSFHWEVPHKPYHADLHIYYKSAKNSASQFSAIASNTEENYQGADSVFALFFLSFCRTYIFIKTYYMPNYLSSQGLWELCIYADPDIRKYNYLIEKFWTDFFPYLDRHTTVHHTLSRLKKEEAEQMNVIVEKMMYELHNLVIEGGLLKDSEQD